MSPAPAINPTASLSGPPARSSTSTRSPTDIAPNINIPGIFIFRIGGPITLNSATGPFEIITSGGTGFGISVRNFGAGLNIINQSGDIATEGVGLDSQSLDAASVINVNATGNITANNNAIDILAGNAVSVISSGDGRFGDHTEAHAGSAKLRMAF